jgi:integrase
LAELPASVGTNGAINCHQKPTASLSVNELILRYWSFAQSYYSKDGKPTKELGCLRDAIRPLRQLYGRTLAADFGPKSLKALRQHLIEQDLCRNVVNRRISRIKRLFKWAASEELVPGTLYHSLQAVSGLRFGRSAARETEPVQPVPDEWVEAVLPYLPPTLVTMVKLQRLTGMRPAEVTLMRGGDIDRSCETWIYEPRDHKTRWCGHHRLIPLGPRAQELLAPFLRRPSKAFLFSPQEAEAWRREHRAASPKSSRKTPVYPSELRARERAKLTRRNRPPRRQRHERYDTDSYRRALTYAIKKARKAGAEIGSWHPNQLRHSRATEIRRSFGIEAAQVVLGHSRADVTEVYAARDVELAKRIAQQTG